MKNYFKENIIYLEERGIKKSLFDNIKEGGLEVIESKTGDPVPAVLTGEGKKLFVHSRIDPVREAERAVSESSFEDKDLIIVFGFGFAYHCEVLLEKCGKDTRVIIIEKEIHILFKALECRDLTRILSDKRISILLDPSEESISAILKGKTSRRAAFVMHRGSYQVYPDYYSDMSLNVKSFISTKDVNIATLSKFEKTWVSNIARNIRIITESSGVNIFFDRFKGIPAIVACAGPSLTRSLDFIRKNQQSAVIVAVDTSYKVLVDNGIEPHFCIAVDPQLINARYFEGIKETSAVLVADPAVHPSLLRFFKGPKVMTGVAFDMMKWIESSSAPRGELTNGGSVSTNAYDFAKRTGASPVIMVGQDLSFTSGLAHARGSYLDEQIFNRGSRFDNPLMFNRRQLAYLPKLMVPGKNGAPVHSTSKMMIFINWFENRNDPDLINASADGVMIKGIKNLRSDEIPFPDEDYKIRELIDELFEKGGDLSGGKREAVIKRADAMLREIEELIPVLEKGVRLSSDLKEMIITGADRSDPGRVNYILKKLSEADAFIENRKSAGPMISFSIQRVIHTITEGYGTGDNDDDNAGARSEFLYRGLMEGALFNRKILGKMKTLF